MTLYDDLKKYAKKNPDGFTVEIINGKIKPLKATSRKRFIIAKTNYDSESKQKEGFKNVKSGIAGGWFDKKSKKYYIDRNIAIGNKDNALRLAVKYNQKAIFDLKDMKEIRTPRPKGSKVVIKKGNRYFNTLTGRYVKKSTFNRYNSYFKKNPKGTLSRAYGDYKYSKDIPVDKLSLKTNTLFYSDTQLIKTKNKKGDTVYYSPIDNDVVSRDIASKIENLDYTILNGLVKVKLYRITRDKHYIYHVFRWNIQKNWSSAFSFENWISNVGIPIMNRILNEVHKIARTKPISKYQTMYGHVELGYYSDIDSFPSSFTFGMGNRPERISHIREFAKEYKKILGKSLYKLETDAYRNLYIQNFSIFIYTERSIGRNDILARYRSGILGVMGKK